MVHIHWNYYEVRYNGKRYRILIPENTSQLWVVHYPDADGMWEMDIDFFGNRKGLEALRNACAALSEKDNMIVYFPCKKNNHSLIYDYFFRNKADCKRNEFVDFVLMKPNSVKISDWKEIRKCISKMKSRPWGYEFPCEFKDIHRKEKYVYRKERPKVVYRFDTVFF